MDRGQSGWSAPQLASHSHQEILPRKEDECLRALHRGQLVPLGAAGNSVGGLLSHRSSFHGAVDVPGLCEGRESNKSVACASATSAAGCCVAATDICTDSAQEAETELKRAQPLPGLPSAPAAARAPPRRRRRWMGSGARAR